MNCNQLRDRLNQLLHEEEKNKLKIELGNEHAKLVADLKKSGNGSLGY